MNGRIARAIAVFVLASNVSAGPIQVMPLYDAFRALCVETNAQPDLVEKAIKVSPNRITQRGSAATSEPIPMSTLLWDMEFEGHKMTLAIGQSREPFDKIMVTNTQNCTIFSYSNENASADAIRKWVGISANGTDSIVSHYEFRLQGSKRIPIRDDEARKSAKTDGQAWLVTLVGNRDMQSVMLTHYLPPHLVN